MQVLFFVSDISSSFRFAIAKMLYSQVVSVLALAASALAAPSADISKRAQTVYLAGDSTMARASGVTTGSCSQIPPHH